VRICRAAFGALEKRSGRALYSWMERHPGAGERKRRALREILLALLLTLAAAAFITTALLRGDGAPQGAPAFETARKPPSN
jgi:hypothetical protein